MPNVEQRKYWDGAGGDHWVAEQARYDRINERFGGYVVEAAGPQPGERFLDVGCGNGSLALSIAGLVGPEGQVTGVDISGPMLDLAQQRAEAAGLGNVTFEKGDAQVHPFAGSFDAAVSRFGVMFFDDPVAAFANLGRALRPGGRLVFVCWQDLFQNQWLMVPAAAALQHVPMPDLGPPGAPGPFALSDPECVRSVLADAGFVDIELQEARAAMHLGDDVDDVVSFFRRSDMAEALMKDVSEEVAEAAWQAVHQALQPHATDDGVSLEGVAWLVTGQRGNL